MKVIIDGLAEEVEGGMSLAELIEARREASAELIVELNHRFVYHRDLASTFLKEGDQVEFIHPAFGG